MKREEFVFNGASQAPYELHGVIWMPDQDKPDKILQITHGMTEHIGRYEELAKKLTDKGMAVAGFDLRGHGKNGGDRTCASFGEHGWAYVLEDMRIFHQFLRKELPETKHFMLGFSLGSFLLREYLNQKIQHSWEKIDGAIIMGTGYQPAPVLSILIKVIENEIKKAGFDHTTALVQNLSFGEYNKKFRPNRTKSDWLCADEKELDAYRSDALCRDDISAGLFADLLSSMKRTGSKHAYDHWDKQMPVLLMSGKEDPVGDMTKGVLTVHKQMIKAGLSNVKLELLDGARHDLLHEYDCGAAEKAIDMIAAWMKVSERI